MFTRLVFGHVVRLDLLQLSQARRLYSKKANNFHRYITSRSCFWGQAARDSLSLQKQRHHSATETLPSLTLSQELKNGLTQGSYLSRLTAASSPARRCKSPSASSFRNIHNMESLQLASKLLSSAANGKRASCFFVHFTPSLPLTVKDVKDQF